ncbi:hypothetical protein BX616_010016 [Lobosporangium transversale]|nr:hypothetical protein BX616_010016 [Lobosporangium transversale]
MMSSRRRRQRLITSTTSFSTQRALYIVEILEHILSFVSQHVLRNITCLVCRQWNALSQRFMLYETLWASNFQPERRLDVMTKFSHCQILTLTPDAPERRSLPYTWPNASHGQRQIAWREVLSHLQNASKEQQLGMIRVLNLRGYLDVRVFHRIVEQCLASQLVVLQFEAFKPGDYFYLEKILKNCPRLEVLKVEPQSDNVHEQAIPGASREDPACVREAVTALRERQVIEPLEWTNKLRLKTLVLCRPMVSQRVLQAILGACPDIKVLKLISVIERASNPLGISPFVAGGYDAHTAYQLLHGTSPFDLEILIAHIARSCPALHTFHFSLDSRKICPETLRLILSRLPMVRHWSFATRDLFDPIMLPLVHSKAVILNRLTTLELKGTGLSDPDRSTSVLSKTLHEFLCTAPTLVHLIAPTVTYYTEYLDLKKALVGSKDTHPNTPRADGRFWACRSLRTLHLEVRARFESDTLHHSRVIFGYLTRVTPCLEDIQLRRPYLSFWLAGGLCLLSRLHNLEKLKLCCRSYTGFHESDVLEWIRREGHPWGRVSTSKIAVSSSVADTARLSCRMAMIRAGLISAPISYHLPASSSSLSISTLTSSMMVASELQMKDFANLGDMRDIDELQIERMLQYQRGQPCWPKLESFTVVHDGWTNTDVTTGIKKLRPDIQFRIETQTYHPNEYS